MIAHEGTSNGEPTYEIWLPLIRSISVHCDRTLNLTVKCDRDETHARLHSKHLIDNSTLWLDPAWEIEIAQGGKDEVWEPVPAEGHNKS